jgi:hypothetical protein
VAQTTGFTWEFAPVDWAMTCPITVDRTVVDPVDMSFEVPNKGYMDAAKKQV